MNKFYISILMILCSAQLLAQNKGINYQAVILDPKAIDVPGVAITGQPLSNGNVCIKFTINHASVVEYEEVQQTKTDEYGLVNLIIGAGKATSNSKIKAFDSIIWDSKTANLMVSVSFDNCMNYQVVTTQPFNYQPYAFYAEAVEYANVRNAPKNLSEFINDVGFITKKDLKPLSDSLRNFINETNQQFSIVNQQISSLQNDVTYLQSDVKNLKVDVNNLQSSINSINSSINSIQSDISSIKSDMWGIRNDIAHHTNQINQLYANDTQLENRINAITNQIGTFGGIYELLGNKSTATDLGGSNPSNTLYPSQKAVKAYADTKATVDSPVFTGTPVLPGSTLAATQGANDNSRAIATTAFVQNAIASGISDATTTFKGKIKLAGDLSGTADSPTVPGLSLKENGANKSSDINLGTSNELYPTQNAVKSYVDNSLINASVADASNSSKGKIQLGGDIAGSNDASAPLITPGAVTTGKLADAAVSGAKIANGAVNNQKIANGAITNDKIGETISIANGGTGATSSAQALLNLGGESLSNKTADVLADGNSDTKFPSAKAVKAYVDHTILSSVPNATNTGLGKIQLAGDLAGSNDATLPRITAGAITSEKIADGAVINNKIASGAVSNASLADGAITNAKIGEAIAINKGGTGATNAQDALNNLGAEGTLNKSTNLVIDGLTDSKYPSTKAVKSYVDAQLASAIATGAPDATTSLTGKVQLAGDLGGDGTTANAPIISNNAINADKLASNSVTTQKIVNASVTDVKIVSVSGAKVTGDITGKAANVTETVDVNHGGTGNAGTLIGYVKGNGIQPMTSSATIPVADVQDAQTISNLKVATDLGGAAASDVFYPSQKAVKTYVDAINNSGVGGATQVSLNGKEDISNKSTNPLLGTSDVFYPSQYAVKQYVDNKLSSANVIQDLTGLPNIANNTILGNQTGTSHTPVEIAITGSGKAVFDSSPTIANSTLSNVQLNGTVSGTAIIPIAQGGSGANMSNSLGYVKQASAGAAFTTIEKIPVTDIEQAVRTVNGVQPDANGNVPITIGRVTTGILSARPNTGNNNGDFYVVSNDGINNGLTYVWDGTTWQEVTPNQASTDSRYVNVTGDTMEGDLIVPTGKKLIVVDQPSAATEVANKSYVDNQVAAATPNATTTQTGKIQLAGDLTGTATQPLIGANKISFDKMQQVGANVVIGSTAAGNLQALSTIPVATLPAFVGDVKVAAGTNTTVLGDKKVTYAKIQDLSGQNKLLGSGQNSGLTATEISLGSGLVMNGNTLETSGVWNGSTVQVPFGGTGATSLTGYVKGSGTSPLTAVTTIPVSDVTNAESNLNKSIATDLGGNTPSDVLYASQKATKTYVDNALSTAIATGAPDATTLATGKVQLAGDLGGQGTTAAAPVISAGVINNTKLADNAITSSKIVDGEVKTQDLANAAVESSKIADFAILTSKISDGAVSNAKIAGDAVTTDKILDGTIQSVDLADQAVTTSKIASGAITNNQIASGAIKNNVIGEPISIANGGTGATTAQGALTNLGAESIANKATDFSSPSNSTYPSTLAVETLVANATLDATTTTKGKLKLAGDLSGTADAPLVADGKITSSKIADGTITSIDIANAAITSNHLADAAVITSKLANDAITTDKIKDGEVKTEDLANGAVESSKIADLAINTQKIAAGAVTNDKIAGPISILNGGTGASTVSDARSNLQAEYVGNKATDFSVLNNTLYPTTLAVNQFVDNAISSKVLPATNTAYGTIKLAGDLTGDAATPNIANNAVTTDKISNGAITNAKIGQTVSVSNGGTGATNLTGYVKGNGTSAMTALTAIPVADVTDAQKQSNLSTDIATDVASDIKYPSTKAVDTYFTNKFQASNGTNVTAGQIEMGGALTKATSISTTSTNTLAFTGLQSGNEEHNTLVVDANGVLKTLPPSQRLKSQIITVNNNYVINDTDYTILANASNGDIQLTLPNPATHLGRFLIIRKTDESIHKLLFDSSIKISESSTFQDINMNVTIRIQSDGSNWYKID